MMRKVTIAFVATAVIAGAGVAPTVASAGGYGNRVDIRADRQDLRADRQDIRRDRADLRQDFRDLGRDPAIERTSRETWRISAATEWICGTIEGTSGRIATTCSSTVAVIDSPRRTRSYRSERPLRHSVAPKPTGPALAGPTTGSAQASPESSNWIPGSRSSAFGL
jgi:hypothetical protein